MGFWSFHSYQALSEHPKQSEHLCTCSLLRWGFSEKFYASDLKPQCIVVLNNPRFFPGTRPWGHPGKYKTFIPRSPWWLPWGHWLYHEVPDSTASGSTYKAIQCKEMVSPASSPASCIGITLHNPATEKQMAKWQSAAPSPPPQKNSSQCPSSYGSRRAEALHYDKEAAQGDLCTNWHQGGPRI